MRRNLPLFAALVAIILWASLATTSQLLQRIAPFMQLTVAFAIGGLPVVRYGWRAFPAWRELLLGVAGFFGYHFFLFTAFRWAPAVEANLINYLWPMLMVLLSPCFFSDIKLKSGHFIGALLALFGVMLLMTGREGELTSKNLAGLGCALLAAFCWPVYSLLKKKSPPTPVWTTAGVCLISAFLCALTHGLTETAVTPTFSEWLGLGWLGLGPFGAAFFLWDYAVKQGDPRAVGALSYLTPVLSTLLLVLVAQQPAGILVWCAMGLMSLGSIVGAWAGR